MTRHRKVTLIILAPLIAAVLAGCGGSGSITASAVVKCAHASHELDGNMADNPSQRQVVAKVAAGGWLYQSYGDETEAERNSEKPEWELYVFKDDQTAQEAFNIIRNAAKPKAEFGAGGTFLRKNLIITTVASVRGSLIGWAEPLLRKCVGAGSTKSIIRPPEEVVDGYSRSQLNKMGEDGDAPIIPNPEDPTGEETSPSESEAPKAGVEGSNEVSPGEVPPSENGPSAGQSPLPTKTTGGE
jgi:hypothetical protein